MRRPRLNRRRGFTLVEVMMSIAVMTVGAVAIFSMQNITAISARRSRQISTATEINRQWIERVKLQAATWSSDRSNTLIPWLDQLPATRTGSSGWFLPAAEGAGLDLVTAASDWYGRPIAIPASGATPAPFCSSLRVTWLNEQVDSLIRVDARTWWHRSGRQAVPIEACGADQAGLTTGLANILDYGVVYGSTVVRWQGVRE